MGDGMFRGLIPGLLLVGAVLGVAVCGVGWLAVHFLPALVCAPFERSNRPRRRDNRLYGEKAQ